MAKVDANGGKDADGSATMVQSILKSKLPPSEKEFDRIHNEVDAVTSAGIETVGQTLRLTCFHIYDNPQILQRLRDELTDVAEYLGPNAASAEGKPILSQLERLPYLSAVVKEGLRMSPGIATRMARIAPDREIRYGSYSIPPGTPVGMTVLLMHYDEKQYPDPQTFNPDRWLNAESSQQGEKIFAPFSRGTRMCVGMQ
jgi:cytochrome P450